VKPKASSAEELVPPAPAPVFEKPVAAVSTVEEKPAPAAVVSAVKAKPPEPVAAPVVKLAPPPRPAGGDDDDDNWSQSSGESGWSDAPKAKTTPTATASAAAVVPETVAQVKKEEAPASAAPALVVDVPMKEGGPVQPPVAPKTTPAAPAAAAAPVPVVAESMEKTPFRAIDEETKSSPALAATAPVAKSSSLFRELYSFESMSEDEARDSFPVSSSDAALLAAMDDEGSKGSSAASASAKLARAQSMAVPPSATASSSLLPPNRKELRKHLSLTNIPPAPHTTVKKTTPLSRQASGVGADKSNTALSNSVLKRSMTKGPAGVAMEEDLVEIADEAEDKANCQPADELAIYQLKGIFNLQDTDNDGLITRPQLVKCLQLLGFQIRDKLLLKYLNPSGSKKSSKTVTATAASASGKKKTPVTNITAYASAKVKLSTFISVTLKELPALHASLEEDLHGLFEFMDPTHSGTVSVKDLRHLLVETLSANRLNGDEFNDVIGALGVHHVQSVRQERDHELKYDNLIDNLLIGRRWKEVVS
jgi:Ca2+-binding EF-hand superfamily protein